MECRNLSRAGLAVAFLVGAVLACGPTGEVKAVTIAINSPGNGSTVTVGQEVLIDSAITAAAGVDRVDLSVSGQVVRHDTPPSGNPTSFQVIQSWTPTAEGQATISVVAYDAAGRRARPRSHYKWQRARQRVVARRVRRQCHRRRCRIDQRKRRHHR